MWLSSLSLFKCLCVSVFCCGLALILNGPLMLLAGGGGGGGRLIFNMHTHLPQSALQAHLWEDCIPQIHRVASFPLCPSLFKAPQWGALPSSSSCQIIQKPLRRGERKPRNSYVSAHSVTPPLQPLPCSPTRPLTSDPCSSDLRRTLDAAEWPSK